MLWLLILFFVELVVHSDAQPCAVNISLNASYTSEVRGHCVSVMDCDYASFDSFPSPIACGRGGSCCYLRSTPLTDVDCAFTSTSVSGQVDAVASSLSTHERDGNASDIFHIRYCCDTLKIAASHLTPLVGLAVKYLFMAPFMSVVITFVLSTLKIKYQSLTANCAEYRTFAVTNLLMRLWPRNAAKYLNAVAVPELVTDGLVYLLTPAMFLSLVEQKGSRLLEREDDQGRRVLERMLDLWHRQSRESQYVHRVWTHESSELRALHALEYAASQQVVQLSPEGVMTKIVDRGEEAMCDLRREDAIRMLSRHEKKDSIEQFPVALQDDEEIAVRAVSGNHFNMRFVSRELRRDATVARKLIQEAGGLALEYLHNELRNDRAIVTLAVSRDGNALKYASKALQNDETIVRCAMSNAAHALHFASVKLRMNRSLVMAAVKLDVQAFSAAASELRESKEFTLEAVRLADKHNFSGMNSMIQELDGTLFDDPDFVVELTTIVHAVWGITGTDWVKNKVSPALWSKREFVLQMVKFDGRFILMTPEELQSDKELVVAAVSSMSSLESMKKHFFDDKDVALVAVRRFEFLQHFSERLRNDKDVVLAAVTSDGCSLRYASPQLQADVEVVLASLGHDERAMVNPFYWASDRLKDNENLVVDALARDGKCFEHASKRIKGIKSIGLVAVSKLGTNLRVCSEELRNDADVVLAAVRNRGDALHFASSAMKEDECIVLAAVACHGRAIEYASETLKQSKKLALVSMQQFGWALQYLSESLRNDRDVVLAAVRQNAGALSHAGDALRADEGVVLEAVLKDGRTLRAASDSLRSNIQFVLAAVAQSGEALEFASEELRNDPLVVLTAVSNCGTALRFASFQLKHHIDVVLAAVKANGEALRYASPALRDHKDIVLEAVRSNVEALQYASDTTQSDEEVVACVLQKKCERIQPEQINVTDQKASRLASECIVSMLSSEKERAAFWKRVVLPLPDLATAPNHYRHAKDFVLRAVAANGLSLQLAADALCDDVDVVRAAVKSDGKAIQYASQRLKENRNIVLLAVQQNGLALGLVPDAFKNDKNVVCEAIRQRGDALQFASDGMRRDRDVVICAIAKDGRSLRFAYHELRSDKEVVLVAVMQDGLALEHAADAWKSDPSVVLAAVRSAGESIRFASSELRDNTEIALAAVQNKGAAAQHISPRLKLDSKVALAAVSQDAATWLLYKAQNTEDFKKVALAALKRNGTYYFNDMSKEFQSDRGVALASIQEGGQSFFLYAGLPSHVDTVGVLRNDKRMVVAGVFYYSVIVKDVSEELRQDRDVMIMHGSATVEELERTMLKLHPHILLRNVFASKASLEGIKRCDVLFSAAIAEGFDVLHESVPNLYGNSLEEEPFIFINDEKNVKTSSWIKLKADLSLLHQLVAAAASYRQRSIAAWDGFLQHCTAETSPTPDMSNLDQDFFPLTDAVAELVPKIMLDRFITPISAVNCFLWDYVSPLSEVLPYAALKITVLELLIKNVYLIISFATLWSELGSRSRDSRSPWAGYNYFVSTCVNGAMGANLVDTAVTYAVWHIYGYFQDGLHIRRRLRLPSLSTSHLYSVEEGESLLSLMRALMVIPCVATITTALPWLITHWVPGVVVYFPFVVALTMTFCLFQSALMYLFRHCHSTENLRKSPTSKALIFLCTFFLRGSAAFFLILLVQAPVNWMTLTYSEPALISTTGYGAAVDLEYKRRSIACFYFSAAVSAVRTLPAILVVL